ncbi:heme exporter protein CcmD [Cognatishimia sp.]|uniref:heme exporter protein CcmD n=1 Tax=Cognatishimia sp. TaxID=2211648 RepID=UPI0035114988|nr:heme exporter protein CcmD [Cognatishimia sp.]
MMPELGKYAGEVLSSYAASLVLLAGLVVVSLRASRKAKMALEALEKGRQDG